MVLSLSNDLLNQDPGLINFDLDEAQLGEDDLDVGLSDAVVNASDWTVETLLNQVVKGNIELNPKFQRREAWTDSRKSKFIGSLFLGLPVPQIVLAERKDKRGSFLVIDGKQRLLAIRRFGSKDGDPDFKPLELSRLKTREHLNGRSYEGLKAEGGHEDELNFFDNQTIRTVIARNWPDEEFLFLVFLHLNTGSVPLSTQELRQALHPGPFVEFADDYTRESIPVRNALRLNSPGFRMRDVEFFVRYFAFTHFIGDYRGNLKAFLDTTCERLNEAWPKQAEDLKTDAAGFDSAITTSMEIFGSDSFRRWSGERYEGPFNRVVFDVMTYYFKDEETRAAASAGGTEVRQAFEKLCSTDKEFSTALQTTTKSITATHARLSRWGRALGKVIEAELRVPKMVRKRIRPKSGIALTQPCQIRNDIGNWANA